MEGRWKKVWKYVEDEKKINKMDKLIVKNKRINKKCVNKTINL